MPGLLASCKTGACRLQAVRPLPCMRMRGSGSLSYRACACCRRDAQLTGLVIMKLCIGGHCAVLLQHLADLGLLPCRHTSRILVIWVTILPFTLWDQCKWFTTPIAAVIAFLLLGAPCDPAAAGCCCGLLPRWGPACLTSAAPAQASSSAHS